MSIAFQRTAVLLLCAALAACGGGGGNTASDSGAAVTGANQNAGTTAGANTATSGGATGAGANQNTGATAGGPGSGSAGSPALLAATASNAPADGATLKDVVALEVRGSGMANVELLPESGYSPKLGVFAVSADGSDARLDFNTRTLPNGVLLARISAFDQPAGGANANEAAAMPARKWILMNSPEPVISQIPPASVMPEVHVSFGNLPYVDPQPLVELNQLDDATFGAMIQNDWPRVESILRAYIPANVVLYPPTPLGFYSAWSACIDRRILGGCREAFVYLVPLMRSKAP